MRDHRLIDARSLAFGRAIAAKLAERPELVGHARGNIERWLKTCSPRARSTLDEWLTALDGPIDGVVALLTGTDERATRLRQSNPFAGALSQRERLEIIRRFRAHDAAAT